MKEVTKKVINGLIEQNQDPSISIYMPTRAAASSEVKKMSIQLKNLLNTTRKILEEEYGIDNKEIEKILKPAADLVEDRIFWQNQKEGLAIFINENYFSYFRVSNEMPEKTTVNKYFDIISLLPEVMFNNNYYVLSLSKNANNVYLCTKRSVEKLDIDGMPESLQDILQYVDTEKTLQYHSHSGGKAIFHGQGVVDDERKEELLQYFRMIDQGLTKYLNQKIGKQKTPLIVMCVKELFPIYKEINTYPYLLDNSVEGNPDDVPPDAINKKTRKIAFEYFKKQISEIDRIYNDLKGTGKTSTQLEDIVSASCFSRIDNLVIKNNISQYGKFDSENNTVQLITNEAKENDFYDLYNFAAINTILNGGQVYVLDGEQMPDGEDILAIYRF